MPILRKFAWLPLIALLAVSPCAHALTVADNPLVAPIPQKPGATTAKEETARYVAWVHRVFVDPLLHRIAGKPWAAEAKQFVQSAMAYLLEGEDEAPAEVQNAAEKLIASGCDDPFLLYLGGRIQPPSRIYLSVPWFRQAMPAAAKLDGPKVLHWLLLCELARKTNGYIANDKEYADAGPLSRAILNDGSFKDGEYEVFIREFTRDLDFLGRNFGAFDGLHEALHLPPWAKKTVEGYLEFGRFRLLAERADDVSARKAQQHFEIAQLALEEAWKLQPSRPEAATAMMRVALEDWSEGDQSVRLWFDRAVAAQFDYTPAYRIMFSTLNPKRIGSVEPILQFGQACYDTGRMETIVPHYMLAAAQEAAIYTRDWKSIYRNRPNISKAVVALSKARVADAPSERARKERNGLLAVNAYLAGNWALALETCANLEPKGGLLAGKLGTQAHAKLSKLKISSFVEEINLAGGPAGREYIESQKLAITGETERAREVLQSAVNKVEPYQSVAARAELAAADFARQYETFAWVNLPIDAEHPMWSIRGTHDDPIASELRQPGEKMRRSRFNFSFPLGDEFEVVAKVKRDPKETQPFIRLFLACRDRGMNFPYPMCLDWAIATIGMDNGRTTVGLADGHLSSLAAAPTESMVEENTVVLRLHAGHISVELNGRVVLDSVPAPAKAARHPQPLFGFYTAPAVASTVSEVKVRKLPAKPRPIEDEDVRSRTPGTPPAPAKLTEA